MGKQVVRFLTLGFMILYLVACSPKSAPTPTLPPTPAPTNSISRSDQNGTHVAEESAFYATAQARASASAVATNTRTNDERNQTARAIASTETPQQSDTTVSEPTPEVESSSLTSVAQVNQSFTQAAILTSTQAARPTETERPSRTPRPTDTDRPIRTPRPSEVETDTYYVVGSTANVRECATSTTSCEVITALSYGDDIKVIERTEGVSVAGSTRWYRVLLNTGREGFIHSSPVSTTRPVAGSSNNSGGSGSGNSGSSNNSGGSGGSTTGSSNNVQPTDVPQQQAQPTQPPPPPPVVGYSCDCSKACTAMASCEEAYFQLQQCGCGRRDGDGDGIPCEDICPGG